MDPLGGLSRLGGVSKRLLDWVVQLSRVRQARLVLQCEGSRHRRW